MQTVPPGRPLPQPNCCFICEQFYPIESNTFYVDTMRDFEPGALTPLTGRKLVCQHCVKDMALELNYLEPHIYAEIMSDSIEQAQKIADLNQWVEDANLQLNAKTDDFIARVLETLRATTSTPNVALPIRGADVKPKETASASTEG